MGKGFFLGADGSSLAGCGPDDFLGKLGLLGIRGFGTDSLALGTLAPSLTPSSSLLKLFLTRKLDGFTLDTEEGFAAVSTLLLSSGCWRSIAMVLFGLGAKGIFGGAGFGLVLLSSAFAMSLTQGGFAVGVIGFGLVTFDSFAMMLEAGFCSGAFGNGTFGVSESWDESGGLGLTGTLKLTLLFSCVFSNLVPKAFIFGGSCMSGALLAVLTVLLGLGAVEVVIPLDRLLSRTGFLAGTTGPEDKVGWTGGFGRTPGVPSVDTFPAWKRAMIAFTSDLLSCKQRFKVKV